MKLKLIKIMRNMSYFKIMCCALCMMLFVPQTSKAEKVQYGKYITYDGKVDANKKPNGKGKLELAYKAQGVVGLETNKDVLEGVFADGKVSNAKLAIAKYNGPLWINSAKFKGTLEFTIADDGSSITYNLLEGELETKDYPAFIISSDTPLTITRIPHPDGCETIAGKLFKANYNSSLSVNNIPNGYFYPLNLSELGNIKNIKKRTTYELNGDFSTIEGDTEYTVELENGGVLSRSDEGFSFRLPNKDFFYTESSNAHGYKFKKTLQEGVLSYEEGDFYLLKGENGKKKGVITITKYNTQTEFMKIMNATTLQSVGGTHYEGQIAELMEKASSGDSQAQYDLAMIFMEGNGVEKDENEGKKWYDKAVENGNESAIARKKAEEDAQQKAKDAQRKEFYDQFCRKHGKKYVDAAMEGKLIVGMPEEVVDYAFGAFFEESTKNGRYAHIYYKKVGLYPGHQSGTDIFRYLPQAVVYFRQGRVSKVEYFDNRSRIHGYTVIG